MTDLVAMGADASANNLGYAPAVDGLSYFNFFGGSRAKTARNLVGSAPANVIGTPSYNDRSVLCTPGVSYLTLPSPQTADMLMIVVAKLLAQTVSEAFMGTYGANRADGTQSRGMFFQQTPGTAGNGTVVVRAGAAEYSGVAGGVSNPLNVESPDIVPAAAWRALAIRRTAATKEVKLYDLTGGVSYSVTGTTAIDLANSLVYVGGTPIPVGDTPVEIAAAGAGAVAPSDANVMAMYAQLQYSLARGTSPIAI